jgi:anti-anti-sigma factor
MTVVLSEHGTATVVRVTGEIDLLTAPDLGAELAHAIELGRAGDRTVVVDLTEVTFMDSSCVHVLLNGGALAERVGVRLVVRKPQGAASMALDICGL